MVIKEEQDLFLAKAAKKKIINKKLVLILNILLIKSLFKYSLIQEHLANISYKRLLS
jgi:hypothetical protein